QRLEFGEGLVVMGVLLVQARRQFGGMRAQRRDDLGVLVLEMLPGQDEVGAQLRQQRAAGGRIAPVDAAEPGEQLCRAEPEPFVDRAVEVVTCGHGASLAESWANRTVRSSG